MPAALPHHLLHALGMAFAMLWELLWALVLGFGLSAAVQAVVSKKEVSKLLPDDSPRSIAIACGLGAASSSCSYAAVALARSLFRKGASFTASIAFEVASTNLVAELGIILAILIGWQFTLAEFAGALGAWIPETFWNRFFLVKHPLLAKFWGPLVGPIVAILSFVCSVGNVPLAAVLWNGGSSFGGVIAFLYADLIVLPILDIYRKYYGGRMSLFLLATLYAAMAITAIVIEFLFQALHLIPAERHPRIVDAPV